MNGTSRIQTLVALCAILAFTDTMASAATITGRVYEGPTGVETDPIQGVTVTLYASQEDGTPGTDVIDTDTTDADGLYVLETGGVLAYDFFNIIQTNLTTPQVTYVDSDPTLQDPNAARSVTGKVISSNWIQYTFAGLFIDNPHDIKTGNKFWDKKESQPPANRPPEANDDVATTTQDTPVVIDVLMNDTDPDGDPLTVQSVTDPPHGSTANNGNSVTYTPDSGYTGLDSFTYTASDGKGGTDPATVSIRVTAAPTVGGTISGYKFEDLNSNGIDDAEPRLPGWSIELWTLVNGQWVYTDTDSTDATGSFSFEDLPLGKYQVREVNQNGWTQTVVPPADLVLTLTGGALGGIVFGNHKDQPSSDIRVDVIELCLYVEIDIPGIGIGRISLTGPATIHTQIGPNGQASDTEGDGLDDVPAEIVSLSLSGVDPLLGAVTLSLSPGTTSTGQFEETANSTPGVLDIAPFTLTGSADSFFDVWFQIELPDLGLTWLSSQAKRLADVISHLPPATSAYTEVAPATIGLLDQNGQATGALLGPICACGSAPPPEGEWDYGDAPEGAVAYPPGAAGPAAVMGAFPTCTTVGPPGSFIRCASSVWVSFGPSFDFEPDGNGGQCGFWAYDQDESFKDGDAGLIMPEPYTINAAGKVVACPGGNGTALGKACGTAVWGQDVDITVAKTDMWQYFNVLIDWDQDGKWGGASTCPGGGTAPEHVLVNEARCGPLWGPPWGVPRSFRIGPNPGYVWARFTISMGPVPKDWDGSGTFAGETEDYLLRIDPADGEAQYDYGDALHWVQSFVGSAGGPAGSAGLIGIREVIGNGDISDQTACYGSLQSGQGTIVDYAASVLNMEEGNASGRFAGDSAFGVVTAGKCSAGNVEDLSLLARGAIRVVTAGDYTFCVNSDDGFTLQFPGRDFKSIHGDGELVSLSGGKALRFSGGRATADTLGVITLQAGTHAFVLTYHEDEGAAGVEFSAAQGAKNAWDASFKLVGAAGGLQLVQPAQYPTLLADNGARHTIVQGVHLGQYIDGEADGRPTPGADGDDLHGGPDDEDGVMFLTPLERNKPAQISVVASAPGKIDAWIDFAGDGSWAETYDRILTSQPVGKGVNSLSFNVPTQAATGIQTYARFRFSTQGSPSYTGAASDGEVEDHQILLGPDGPYPPGGGSSANTGTIIVKKWEDKDGDHQWDSDEMGIDGWAFYLSAVVTASEKVPDEFIRSPGKDCSGAAIVNGDLTFASDADYIWDLLPDCSDLASVGGNLYIPDGWTLTIHTSQPPTPGYYLLLTYGGYAAVGSAAFDVSSAPNWKADALSIAHDTQAKKVYLRVHAGPGSVIDTGTTDTDGECIFSGLAPGQYIVAEEHPSGWTQAHPGGDGTYTVTVDPLEPPAEVWFGNQRTGQTSDGQHDHGDAPYDGIDYFYPDASHELGGPYWGKPNEAPPDADPGMQPHPQALGDDLDLDGHDENGLGEAQIYQGKPSFLRLYCYVPTSSMVTLAAWLDWNADGDWDDQGELVSTWSSAKQKQGAWEWWCSFTLPPTAKVGPTFARFRIYEGENITVSPSGPGGPGEVEDHFVEIKAAGSGLPPGVALPPTGGVAPGAVLPPAPTLPPGYCIWGYKYNDLNANGNWDQGEQPVANWTMWLDTNNDGTADVYTSMNASGVFIFPGLQPKAYPYKVGEELQVGWTQTYPTGGTHSVTIQSGQQVFQGVAFGNRQTGGLGEGERWRNLKWSQPVIEIDPQVGQTPVFCGWDEPAFSVLGPRGQRLWFMAADDFHCLGPIPVTSVRWWGSFAGWTAGELPPVVPTEFHIGIWSGVPAGADPAYPSGHPEKLVWETTADDWTWQFAGYEQTAAGLGTSGPSTGLVAHWKLDGDATDSAGTNHGTVRGNPVWATGKVGSALKLDGVGDYVDCGNGASLNITEAITLSAWVNPADAGNGQHNPFVTKGDQAYAIKHNISDQIETFIYEGGWHTATYAVDASFNGGWHHVASTYDGVNLRLYVDGVLRATTEYVGSIAGTTYNVNLGRNSQNTDRFYEGLLDEVRVYNRALSADEIKSLVTPTQQQTDETCFEFNCDLPTGDWFHQEQFQTRDEVFWLSITAVYPGSSEGPNPWGWASRPDIWRDGAVGFECTGQRPQAGQVLDPQGMTPVLDAACGYEQAYDMAFELRTDPDWVKWDEPFTGIRDWPYYDDHASYATESANGVVTIVQQVADDWPGERPSYPVIAMAWQGSYLGYGYEACRCDPVLEPRRPDYFQLLIRTNLPPGGGNPLDRPGDVVWAYEAFDYDEVLVGYDRNPLGEPNEPVFRYTARLPRDMWFWHEGDRAYWLSIMAVYVAAPAQIRYPWGWTNHEHQFGSAASKLSSTNPGLVRHPLSNPAGGLIDMSFTLYTTSESRPIAHWRFDETQGTIAVDSAGGHNGAIHGATWTTGATGGAMRFDGGDYVEVADEADFDITDAITVAAWVNLEAVPADYIGIVTKGDSTWRLSTLRAERKFHFAVNDPLGVFHAVDGATGVGLNEWHHVVGMYDASSLRLYVDGVEEPAGPVAHTGPIHVDDFLVWIGANAERPGRGFVGRIDEVHVYDRALTQTEVLEMMAPADNAAPKQPPSGR